MPNKKQQEVLQDPDIKFLDEITGDYGLPLSIQEKLMSYIADACMWRKKRKHDRERAPKRNPDQLKLDF
jgi:hypothetical protein